jgi:hypothetical protein
MARAPMPAPQMIETPAMRRSAMLAKLLEEQRQPVEIKGGYGELAARLLGQGITQFGANRAERAVRDERARRTTGEADAFGLTLASVLRDSGGAPPATDMPPAAPPPMVPPVSNTQQPVEAMTAPVAAVAGSPMPPAAPAGMPAPMPPMADVPPMPQPAAPLVSAPQAAPQSAANPLGITPGEMARIQEGVDAFRRTGDPAIGAWVRGEIDLVRQRMSAPAAERQEFQSINGVPGVIDPVTRQWTPLEGGIPQQAMNTNQVVGAGNVFGLPEGSGVSVNPFGVPSVVGRPTEGYERVGGQLRPEAGGREDLNAPTRRFAELTNLRKEVDPIIDSATLLQRNIQALRAGSRAQNGAGDIAMINGLQKLIDEGVVREGDVALQLQAQGINGGIAGLQGYLTSSGRFSPEIRSQLLATGEDIYQNMNAVYRDRVLSYEPLVTETFGAGAFNNVLPSRTREAFGWGGGEAPAPRPQPRPAAPSRPRQPAAPPRSNGQTRRYNPNTGQLE